METFHEIQQQLILLTRERIEDERKHGAARDNRRKIESILKVIFERLSQMVTSLEHLNKTCGAAASTIKAQAETIATQAATIKSLQTQVDAGITDAQVDAALKPVDDAITAANPQAEPAPQQDPPPVAFPQPGV